MSATATATEKTSKAKATKKPAAKKSAAAKKPVAEKKVAKAVAKVAVEEKTSRITELFANFKDKAGQSRESGKKAGLAYLGVYGKAYDFARAQYEKAQQAQSERFEDLVVRGGQLQEQADSKIKSLDLPEFDLSSLDAESLKARVQEQVEAARARVETRVESARDAAESAAEVASEKFDEFKARILPAKG